MLVGVFDSLEKMRLTYASRPTNDTSLAESVSTRLGLRFEAGKAVSVRG